MTAADFDGWMMQHDLDPAAAAERLSALTGVTYRTEQVYQFRKGSRPVPARVRLAIASVSAAAERKADVLARLLHR